MRQIEGYVIDFVWLYVAEFILRVKRFQELSTGSSPFDKSAWDVLFIFIPDAAVQEESEGQTKVYPTPVFL